RGLAEALWIRKLLSEIGYHSTQTSKIICDNKAAIQIFENPVQHDRTKHIEVDRHFIKEKLENGIIELLFVRSKDQLADILTKAGVFLYKCKRFKPQGLSNFDQPQPPQSPVIHQPPQELSIQEMENLKQQYLDKLKRLSNLEYRDEIKIAELKENFNGGIDDDILLTIKDDILHEKLLNVNLLIAKIEALNANPTPSSDCKTKSSSTSLNSLLEETNTFDNLLPEFETFCFDVEEISSGSTTTHSDISLLEYEVFYDDHVKEISSDSPTTHFDSPLYESFIFDLSINPFPPAEMSDFYEFIDEFIPFISQPEYDYFLFKVEPNSRDFTKDVVEDISPTKEP
nr:putative copia-type protein [Tanacetum cinerariifolium]